MGMKRVLIICYYWPPAGGPGVQRWLKFVKYFRDFGVTPIVFAPAGAYYPLQDDSLVAEVPRGVEVIRFPVKEPYRFAKWISGNKTKTISSGIISERNPSILEKLMLYVRGNLFIPDARVGMVKPALEFLHDYLSQTTIDTIITTGPPHSMHLIGLSLRKELEIPWIADFRDPWTTIHYHRSLNLTRSSEKKHKALEKEVLNTADVIVVTSPNTKKEFAAITNKPISVITNGYDVPELLSETTTAGGEIRRIPDPKFTIVHIGSLLSHRNPIVLWKVLSELIESHPKFADNCLIKLVGATGKDVIMSLFEFGLEHYFEDSGYVSHSEAMQLQRNAQILLLVEIDRSETKAIIPGKLFEYLYARRPIIALGPAGSDIEGIIDETRSGRFFNYSEQEQLKEQLLQYFDDYLNDNLNVASENIEKYSRRELTKKMAEIVNNV